LLCENSTDFCRRLFSLGGVAEDVRGEHVQNSDRWLAEEQPEILTPQILDFLEEKKNADKKSFEEKGNENN
jgi:hypothetical protein